MPQAFDFQIGKDQYLYGINDFVGTTNPLTLPETEAPQLLGWDDAQQQAQNYAPIQPQVPEAQPQQFMAVQQADSVSQGARSGDSSSQQQTQDLASLEAQLEGFKMQNAASIADGDMQEDIMMDALTKLAKGGYQMPQNMDYAKMNIVNMGAQTQEVPLFRKLKNAAIALENDNLERASSQAQITELSQKIVFKKAEIAANVARNAPQKQAPSSGLKYNEQEIGRIMNTYQIKNSFTAIAHDLLTKAVPTETQMKYSTILHPTSGWPVELPDGPRFIETDVATKTLIEGRDTIYSSFIEKTINGRAEALPAHNTLMEHYEAMPGMVIDTAQRCGQTIPQHELDVLNVGGPQALFNFNQILARCNRSYKLPDGINANAMYFDCLAHVNRVTGKLIQGLRPNYFAEKKAQREQGRGGQTRGGPQQLPSGQQTQGWQNQEETHNQYQNQRHPGNQRYQQRRGQNQNQPKRYATKKQNFNNTNW